MAFVILPSIPTIHRNRLSALRNNSPSRRLSSHNLACCPRRHHLSVATVLNASLDPQKETSTTKGVEREKIITSSTDNDRSNTVLSTPVYSPSPFTLLYDLLRQDLRNRDVARSHGPVYKADNLFGPMTMITGYDAVVEAARTPHLFTVSKAFPAQLDKLLGDDTILSIDGNAHKKTRGRVSPVFAPSMIPGYHKMIVDHARAFFRSMAAQKSATSGPVEATGLVKDYFLELIVKLTLGTDRSQDASDSQHAQDYNTTFKKLSDLFIQVVRGLSSLTFMPTFRKALQARDSLDNELQLLILRRLHSRNERARLRDVRNCLKDDKIASILREGRVDLMSIIIATSSLKLPEGDDDALYDSEDDVAEVQSLVAILRFLWFAGYATQSSTLLCVLMEIFSNPLVMRRLQDEQSHVPELTLQSITNDMPLLSSVLTESMRVNTAVISTFRRTTEDVFVLQHLIPKGTTVGVDFSCANGDASIFQNPDEFIPDRFVNKPDLARKVIVFGAPGSPHYCVGASLATLVLKTTLAVMVREFDVDVKPWKRRSVKTLPETVPRDGVWIRACVQKSAR